MYNNSEIWNYEMLALDIRIALIHLGEMTLFSGMSSAPVNSIETTDA